MISIIVPTLNEEDSLAECLKNLRKIIRDNDEIIVVDGQSEDKTVAIAATSSVKVVHSSRGRGAQMNAGAEAARNSILWFLHSDCLPRKECRLEIANAVRQNFDWGFFDIQFSNMNWKYRVLETCMNARSRISQIATGDKGIFCRKELFIAVGGFPKIEIMEDLELSKRLRKYKLICVESRIIASARKWESEGFIRTIVLMWFLRFCWFIGFPSSLLHSYYYKN